MINFLRCISIALSCALLSGCSLWGTAADSKAESQKSFSNSAPLSTSSIKNVALLLPLTGSLSGAGQAVRDGFITAYNNDTSTDKPAHFILIDSNSVPIAEAYAKAVQANADRVIGPLAKTNVQALVKAKVISLPTLALNYLDTPDIAPTKLLQYGLSPLDEARQVASLARQNGGQNAAILAPDNSWGNTLAQAYQEAWQSLGGKVTKKLLFSADSATLNDQIRQLSKAGKFDVVLLAASPTLARQIKPLFKFYRTDDTPVYATSLVYSGTPQPAFDNDLNGITFCDMPWTLIETPINHKLRQQIALFWPVNFKQNARLYALGIDAYKLLTTPGLFNNAAPSIAGATGALTLNQQRLIVRQLSCAQFENGVPKILGAPPATPESAEDTAKAQDTDKDEPADTESDADDTSADSIDNADSMDDEQD